MREHHNSTAPVARKSPDFSRRDVPRPAVRPEVLAFVIAVGFILVCMLLMDDMLLPLPLLAD